MVAIPHQALLAIPTTRSGVTATWNPADKSSSITLSNANLTAAGASFNFSGVRSTTSKVLASGGKFYFELACNNLFADNRSWIGIGDSLMTLTAGNGGPHSLSLNKDGTLIQASGNFPLTLTLGPINNKTIGVAIDFTAGKWWVTYDGITWNAGGTADPTTGVGGQVFTTQLTTAAFIACSIIDTGASVTLNGGNTGTPFALTQPAGFTIWDS